jgi:hypothetical protein
MRRGTAVDDLGDPARRMNAMVHLWALLTRGGDYLFVFAKAVLMVH